MSNSGDNLSALFRSLGPDDANFLTKTNAFVQEGEQRWPLFKTVSPAKPEPTPELSAQERLRWSNQEKPDVAARKPVLTLPPFSERLAMSLSRISKQTEMDAAKSAVGFEQARSQRESFNGRRLEPQPGTSINVNEPKITPKPHFLQPPVVAPRLEVEPPLSFEHTAVMPAEAMSDAPTTTSADDSLVGLFGRLQGREKVVDKPTEKRSLFFGRLGKR